MSDNSLKELMEMGFSEEKSKKALSLNNQDLQQAVEWLFAHANEAEPSPSNSQETNTLKLVSPTAAAAVESQKDDEKATEENEASLSANSLKCDDCGMLLKDEDFATLHAHKTGHVNFSQSTESIKPKTKEEIEEQKKRLSEKLAKIRQEKQEKEKAEQIQSEIARRKQGRQINEIKQKFHEEEMKRIAEEKRRDKLADAAYKQKVKEQIAKDREAFRKEKETASASPSPAVAAQPAPVINQEKRDYAECRIQIRLTDGKSIVQKFDAKEPLAAVRLWIEMNRTDGTGSFNIMQTFPRKVYTDDDMMRSLTDLGLVPASSLVITKS